MSILSKAVALSEGMNITFPLWNKSEKLNLPSKRTPKTYNTIGSRITFVNEDGITFAIPAIDGVEEALISKGYKKTDMYVFFSGGEAYPTEKKEEWEALLKLMRTA